MNSSHTSLEELHQLELKISQEIAIYQHCDKVNESPARNRFHELIIPFTRNYNKILNKLLKEYNKIEYTAEPKKKAVYKAAISYSYHFLDMLMRILRLLEKNALSTEFIYDNITLLKEFCDRKEELLNMQYYPKAQDELADFYDSEKRNQLDANLKKFLDKHQNQQKRKNKFSK
ncbi:hypothetical protein [Candidatus Harpocratesius sp.]